MDQGRRHGGSTLVPDAGGDDDGRILAVSGRGGPTPEIFDGTSWQPVAGATRDLPELYPSLNLVTSGDVFTHGAAGTSPNSPSLRPDTCG
jgi:hypothetical protein